MIKHSAKLPAGFTVHFSFAAGVVNCEWEPGVPSRKLSRRKRERLLTGYLRERNLFIAKLATVIGGNIVVADLHDGDIAGVTPVTPGTRQ